MDVLSVHSFVLSLGLPVWSVYLPAARPPTPPICPSGVSAAEALLGYGAIPDTPWQGFIVSWHGSLSHWYQMQHCTASECIDTPFQ